MVPNRRNHPICVIAGGIAHLPQMGGKADIYLHMLINPDKSPHKVQFGHSVHKGRVHPCRAKETDPLTVVAMRSKCH